MHYKSVSLFSRYYSNNNNINYNNHNNNNHNNNHNNNNNKYVYSVLSEIVKIGPSSNEGLKYRDIEIVKFESGPCCYHFFRGTIYIFKPLC